MKKQTYDVPAYKVGIVQIKNSDPSVSYSPDEYESAISEKRAFLIPFEAVDGLECQEVQKFLKVKDVMLEFYADFNSKGLDGFLEKRHIRFETWFYIAGDWLEENKTTPIDQVVETALEEFYEEMDPLQKRCAHCFFERYQDKSYELTKERIKRLEENKN